MKRLQPVLELLLFFLIIYSIYILKNQFSTIAFIINGALWCVLYVNVRLRSLVNWRGHFGYPGESHFLACSFLGVTTIFYVGGFIAYLISSGFTVPITALLQKPSFLVAQCANNISLLIMNIFYYLNSKYSDDPTAVRTDNLYE